MNPKSTQQLACLFATLILLAAVPLFASQSITAQIDAITQRAAVSANSWSMLVESVDGAVTSYQKNPTTTEAPASNMKLMTSSAAFGLLGTTNFFTSLAYGNGTVAGGKLTGDLNLLVKHDITWNTSVFGAGNARKPLDFIAGQIKALGITNITGNVQIYGACMYNHADTDDTRDTANQATYNAEGAVAFVAALQAQGITVAGSGLGKSGFTPPGTLLYTYKSTSLTYGGNPLRLDVACIAMNKVSHNVMADLLLRHIAFDLGGSDSFGVGATKVFGWLATTVGLSTNGMVMLDGSGLSHSDRMSAREISTVVRYMLGHFSTWATTLPIGCVDGTLGSRFCGTDGSGHVHAKTGSLSISIDLSGYVDNPHNGQRYFFSFLANNAAGIDQASTRDALDDAVNVIAGVVPVTVDNSAGNDGDRSMDIFLPDAVNLTEIDPQNGANGSLAGWSSLGGPVGFGESPVVGYNADQRLQIFVRGTDNNIWSAAKTALNGSWGAWANLGGNVRGNVSIGRLTNGAMQLFARSSSNTVITMNQTGPNAGWTAWSDLGDSCFDDPTIGANADGRFQLFTRSSTNSIHSNFKTTGGAWFGWSDYGGSCFGKPGVGNLEDGSIAVFTRTSSNTVQTIAQTAPNGSFGPWSDLGGSCFSDPAVGYNLDGRMELFVQTSAHAVSTDTKTTVSPTAPWSGWVNLAGSCYTNLTVGYNADGRIQLAMRDASFVMQSAWQTNVNAGFSGWFAFAGNTPVVTITTPPSSQTVNQNQNAPFSVVAANALSYQWQFNGGNISGATASAHVVSNAQLSDAGNYTVIVGNHAGSVTSATAVLTVIGATPPSITTPPVSQTVNQGQSATFSVVAAGTAPLSYQWRLNTLSIINATNASYTRLNCQSSDAGSYSCQVTNIAGSIISADALLTVHTPPTITDQPDSQRANVSNSVVFAVAASGAAPLTYQWRKNGAALSGATLSTFSLSALKWTNGGSYTVVISNSVGSATSANAVLTMQQAAFTFTEGFESYNVGVLDKNLAGGPNTNSANPWWGPHTPNVAVYTNRGGVTPHGGAKMISGVTNVNLCQNYFNLPFRLNARSNYFGNILLEWWFYDPKGAGVGSSNYVDYIALAENLPVSTTSDFTTTTFTNFSQRVSLGSFNGAGFHSNVYQARIVGATGGFNVNGWFNTGAARGIGWHHARIVAGLPVASSAPLQMFIDNMTNAAFSYASSGTNVGFNLIELNTSFGGANTGGYFDDLSFRAANDPWIAQQPANATVTAGQNATFQAVAIGTGYQWQFNGSPISGATATSLVLTAVDAGDAGSYNCVVTGANGTTNTATVTLTVQ